MNPIGHSCARERIFMFWISIVSIIFAVLLVKLGILTVVVKLLGALLGMALTAILAIAAVFGWRWYRSRKVNLPGGNHEPDSL